MEQASTPLQRITVIDALRGFTLLGVLLVHMLSRFSIAAGQRVQTFPVLDEFIQQFTRSYISGKFIGIFAFLFGLSFFILMDRAAKKGSDFRNRFLWRMVILFFIGIIGNAFYANDIISMYAVFGMVLVLLYKAKNWLLVSLIALLLIGTPRIIMTGYDNIFKSEQVENVQSENRGSERSLAGRTRPSMENATFLSDAKYKLIPNFYRRT